MTQKGVVRLFFKKQISLAIGYARAGRIMDQMISEPEDVKGPAAALHQGSHQSCILYKRIL